MEVRGVDHAADEVLATTATPEPALGGVQVSEAAGEDEQAQDAPAATNDDDLFNTPNGRRLSSSPEAAAATKKFKLARVQGSPAFPQDMDVDFLGGTGVPATMAGKMRNLGPISPDFVYGSSSDRFPLENQGGMEGQSQRLPSVENEERPAFAPEQAQKNGVSLHSAPQARQVGGTAKPSNGGDQPTVTHSASNRAQEGAERSGPDQPRFRIIQFWHQAYSNSNRNLVLQ
eukprot:SAG11_NODE_2456_length_3327_cov_7.373728_2_plen_230_part_00